jgi:hypothetical protein
MSWLIAMGGGISAAAMLLESMGLETMGARP